MNFKLFFVFMSYELMIALIKNDLFKEKSKLFHISFYLSNMMILFFYMWVHEMSLARFFFFFSLIHLFLVYLYNFNVVTLSATVVGLVKGVW